jgi:hypothetical protein
LTDQDVRYSEAMLGASALYQAKRRGEERDHALAADVASPASFFT